MNNQEIHDEIIANEEAIMALLDPSQFDLQNNVWKLRKRNEELQTICTHDFQGTNCCYYCHKLKTE